MKSLLIHGCLLGPGITLFPSLSPTLPAQDVSTADLGEQQQLEAKLRRDQQAILRKAERLRDLMKDLRSRYIGVGRKREVELLDKGLEHLEKISLLETVASVRDALDAKALSQANQKAAKVVKDLQELLQILLDRPSMEKIDEEIKKTLKMEATAAELEQRQTDLLNKNRETSRQAASKTEQDLVQRLRNLARMQEEESMQNAREAGERQPFLEDAMRRIAALLANQKRLENAIRKEREDPSSKNPAKDQMFELGGLQTQTLEQLGDRTRQRGLERVAEDARRLRDAAKRRDSADIEDAKDDLRNEMARAAANQQGDIAEEIEKLLKELEAENKDLEEIAAKVEQAATTEAKRQQGENNSRLDQLNSRAQKALEQMAADRKAQNPNSKAGKPENDLKKALDALKQAAEQGERDGETQRTQSALSQALRRMEEARNGIRRANPDPKDRAGRMATEAAEVARDLRESPGSDPEKDQDAPAENRAARALDKAEQKLRKAAEELQKAAERRQRDRDPKSEAQRQAEIDRQLADAKQELQRAHKTLEDELQRNGQPQQARDQAIKRQQQLAQQAQRLRDRMQQAQQNGDLSRQQQQAADRQMQQAQRQMQQAQKSLQQNRQSQAARRQLQAADSLDQAIEQISRNRPLNKEQKDQLKKQAEEQKQLADDIMRLAKLAEERKNQRAQQALDQAAQAAAEAAEKLDEGDSDEAEKKQEEAKKNLAEAREALEEERERYEDLRQEELLFKIRDELKQFLTKQQPITQKTEAARKQLAETGRLSRRSRRRLNELGEEEQELAGSAKFLREALEKEQVLVFSHALQANEQDLFEVKNRLGGRRPRPDEVTIVLQKDVEDRTMKLIEALEREQRRRQEQRKQGDRNQRQNNGQNQRRRLVSLTAELEMLKQMEEDMLKRTQFMGKLITARGDDVSEIDLALLERLAHRHNQITEIFLALKKQVEQAMNPEAGDGEDPKKDKKDGK